MGVGRLFGIDASSKTFSFRCTECGEMHRGAPSFAMRKPCYVFDVPEAEWAERVELTSDFCRIMPGQGSDDPVIHAIRTTLDIPIIGSDQPFCWGVWVSVSETSYDRYGETFDDDQTGAGCFGWLPVTIPHYRRTGADEFLEHLACDVDWHGGGQRPKLRLQSADHPLYRDQQDGISWDTAVAIARAVMHGH